MRSQRDWIPLTTPLRPTCFFQTRGQSNEAVVLAESCKQRAKEAPFLGELEIIFFIEGAHGEVHD